MNGRYYLPLLSSGSSSLVQPPERSTRPDQTHQNGIDQSRTLNPDSLGWDGEPSSASSAPFSLVAILCRLGWARRPHSFTNSRGDPGSARFWKAGGLPLLVSIFKTPEASKPSATILQKECELYRVRQARIHTVFRRCPTLTPTILPAGGEQPISLRLTGSH